jgi:hypothetical protein
MDRSRQLFHEVQGLPLRRIAAVLAIPPCGMLGLLIWQVVLRHPWGKQPMSDASVIGWTVFLWIIYFRLITVRLVTDVRDTELVVSLRGFWRARRTLLSDIRSAEMITYDPERDYGGYGIRTGRFGTAYVAGGQRGVCLKLVNGSTLVVGSQRPEELAGILLGSATRTSTSRNASQMPRAKKGSL